ncbi:Wolframin like protein [Argiope bruennichi]|uniref:Wolframin like protein n=1 Tax=Argiope bruennichi TaxID=94029 RepID=A0A8T0FG51_ARGBR|nr:Wolframin like protein [Argiope bruennichi]
MKNSTNAMPESCQGGSISRTLLLPREHHLGTGSLGTFRLRHILAEDGCKESQVALAKSLLTIPSNNFEERSFNAQLAVYWLLQAAEKGQEEAFSLLKECVSGGVGINARNHPEIEKCLKFSDEEKISRRVAYSLFEAIMSDTEDLVPEQVFREKIETILKEESKEKLSAKAAEDPPLPQQQPCQKKIDEASLRNQAHVSFSEVVNSVQSCLEGNVPLVSLKQVTHYAEYKRWLSTKYLRILWDLVLRSAENLFQNLSSLAVKPEVQKAGTAPGEIIPWEKYQTYCHHHAWYRTNTAEVQISCLPLKGREISLEGTITAVDVIHVKNNMQLIANIMPQPLQDWFVCLFGKNYANCDSETLSQFEKERCKLYENLNINKCHLHNWNEYKYQIALEVSSRTSPEVILFAGNACTEFVTNLKEGDSLKVIGVLESNIGSSSPRLTIRQAQCTSCYADVACNSFSALPLPDYRLSVKNLIKLYFEPFLQYEPK